MPIISRITDPLRRRYPRAYTAAVLVLSVAILVGFAAWDITRVQASPIRGTSEWALGLILGGGTGVAATLAWAWIAWQPDCASRWWRPWQWASSILLMITLATTHSKGGEQPRVDGTYSVGALSYVITSFMGICLFFGLVGLARVRRRWRMRHPREGTAAAVRRRPLSRRGKRTNRKYRAR